MSIYVAIWIILVFLSFKKRSYPLNILFWILFAVLIFIAGGRTLDVGVDTKAYNDIFDHIRSNGYLSYLEPSWNILNIVIGKITSNYNIFLLVVSTITLYPVFLISSRESRNMYFSILIYFSMHLFTGSFNATRQYCGLSFVLLGYYFLSKNKQIHFYMFVLLATSIHYSSIFAFLILFHRFIPTNINKVFIIILISFVFGSLVNEQILSKLPLFKFQGYISGDGLYKDNYAAAVIMTMLMNAFAIIILSTNKYDTSNFWYKIFVFSIIILNLTYTLEYGTRLYNLFAISHIIFIPMYLRQNKVRQKPSVYTFIILFYMVLFFRMLINDGNQVTPYVNVFI